MAFDFSELEHKQDNRLTDAFNRALYVDALKEYDDDFREDEIIETEDVELENSYDFLTEKVMAIVDCKVDKNSLELTTIYYNLAGRQFGARISVSGRENVAKLLKYFNVSTSDLPNLLDNLIEALADYGNEHGFEDAADFKPLLQELGIPFKESNGN